jgi:hypothetical protein
VSATAVVSPESSDAASKPDARTSKPSVEKSRVQASSAAIAPSIAGRSARRGARGRCRSVDASSTALLFGMAPEGFEHTNGAGVTPSIAEWPLSWPREPKRANRES